MRDIDRHPEPTAPNLGQLCLEAVANDNRLDERVRNQAQQLLDLCSQSEVQPDKRREGRLTFAQ